MKYHIIPYHPDGWCVKTDKEAFKDSLFKCGTQKEAVRWAKEKGDAIEILTHRKTGAIRDRLIVKAK